MTLSKKPTPWLARWLVLGAWQIHANVSLNCLLFLMVIWTCKEHIYTELSVGSWPVIPQWVRQGLAAAQAQRTLLKLPGLVPRRCSVKDCFKESSCCSFERPVQVPALNPLPEMPLSFDLYHREFRKLSLI